MDLPYSRNPTNRSSNCFPFHLHELLMQVRSEDKTSYRILLTSFDLYKKLKISFLMLSLFNEKH
jgi:hypothetical protein